ncbi:MAG: transcription-repair coupling factor (superfamily II helicase) [Halieaceae bacterium]|jgi:transcription-repair coupling factor (superfamily II helicase)
MTADAIEQLNLPLLPGTRQAIGPVYGCMPSYLVAELATRSDKLVMVVTPSNQAAQELERELRFFSRDADLSVMVFPDWETLPYDTFSPHQDIISERLQTLYELPSSRKGILITPVTTLMHRLPPREFITNNSLVLKCGESIRLEDFRRQLESSGYTCVDTVYERGEFALRGSIIDLFPMGSDHPYRIDLLDEEIDTLRTFEPETQRTLEQVEAIKLLPAREFAFDKNGIERFKTAWLDSFDVDYRRCHTFTEVSSGRIPGGTEYYMPLFFETCGTLLDYLPDNVVVATLGEHYSAGESFWREVNDRFEEYGVDPQRPLLPPKRGFVPVEELYGALKNFAIVEMRLNVDAPAHINLSHPPPPNLSPQKAGESALDNFINLVEEHRGNVLLCAESAGRREVLLEQLSNSNLEIESFDSWPAFVDSNSRIGITVAPIDRGLFFDDDNATLVCEAQLYGERVAQRRLRKSQAASRENVVRDLTELRNGAPVVHLEHGVGRYLGLQVLEFDNQATEFLALQYGDEAKLYVPVSSLHLISRYSGADPELAPLHKLGSEQWKKARRKAAEKVNDVAAELLAIYAEREAREGFTFVHPGNDYDTFSSNFPFEETPDQQTAIDDVLSDMCGERPMDRLVCGDVGFGKTEVAMRATFCAVHNGKQVAVLVPTTLLAQQHFESFSDRFAGWPFNVEVISRFKSSAEQKDVIERLAQGKVDILIGTHRLLQSSLKYPDLGLVIIDEEHRFGVKQKDSLKALRAEVDILTLTATPIPRTLNMAISGMRDLSIIATPPARRLSIKTFVREFDTAVIKEAILRETLRGGQVYYLHNEVKTIEESARKLRELLPELQIGVAHGQLRETQLERVMSDFYHQKYHVLMCSTIIETGIDVPNANTIVMERADRLGLAQLHQLRGRVGRSHHQAYAYLLCPPRAAMTADSIKRLEAISEAGDLGAGFMLATHDLEIRGAGELLGEGQSGQIHSVGFTMYMDMLERAVASLQNGELLSLDADDTPSTEVNMRLPALIPDDYLPDINSRLILYKRMSAANDSAQLRDLQVEMIDRFGLLPQAVKNLFRVTELKLRAALCGIRKINAGENGGSLEFEESTSIDPLALVKLVQGNPDTYRLSGATGLRFSAALSDHEDRFVCVENLLSLLNKPTKAPKR